MALSEYILIPGSAILGVGFVYFLILKCAHNDWIGKIPSGPQGLPLLGCVFIYLRMIAIQNMIEDFFKEYGWMFQMRAGLQKIVFIQHNDELHHALEEHQIVSTTIRDVVTSLRKFGMKRFKRREIIFIQKVWEKHIGSFTSVADDATLVKRIADKIFEEDSAQTITEGNLLDKPAKLDTFKPSLLSEESLERERLTSETLQTLRSLLLEHAHIWLSSTLVFLYFTRKQKIKQIRLKGETCFADLKGYLERVLLEQNIFTEKKFLVLLYLLVKLSSFSAIGKTELKLGPDFDGWRSFACQSYARVGEYDIPKKANIYAKQKI